MRTRLALASLLLVVALAPACGGTADGALVQDGPTLRTTAEDGTLVVEGRVLNLSSRGVEGAQVEVVVRLTGAVPITLSAPLGAAGSLAPFEAVTFRVSTGVLADESAQVSVTLAGSEAP